MRTPFSARSHCWLAVIAAGVAAGSGACTTPALGSSVSVEAFGNVARVGYDAGLGETNRVRVIAVDDLTVRLSDEGAVIEPLGGCRLLDAHTAECSTVDMPGPPTVFAVDIRAADGDDIVETSGPGLFTTVSTADGDDFVRSDGFLVASGGSETTA